MEKYTFNATELELIYNYFVKNHKRVYDGNYTDENHIGRPFFKHFLRISYSEKEKEYLSFQKKYNLNNTSTNEEFLKSFIDFISNKKYTLFEKIEKVKDLSYKTQKNALTPYLNMMKNGEHGDITLSGFKYFLENEYLNNSKESLFFTGVGKNTKELLKERVKVKDIFDNYLNNLLDNSKKITSSEFLVNKEIFEKAYQLYVNNATMKDLQKVLGFSHFMLKNKLDKEVIMDSLDIYAKNIETINEFKYCFLFKKLNMLKKQKLITQEDIDSKEHLSGLLNRDFNILVEKVENDNNLTTSFLIDLRKTKMTDKEVLKGVSSFFVIMSGGGDVYSNGIITARVKNRGIFTELQIESNDSEKAKNVLLATETALEEICLFKSYDRAKILDLFKKRFDEVLEYLDLKSIIELDPKTTRKFKL